MALTPERTGSLCPERKTEEVKNAEEEEELRMRRTEAETEKRKETAVRKRILGSFGCTSSLPGAY